VAYHDRFTKDDNARSREMFEKAIELDPGYARAITKKTWTYLQEYWNGWTDAPDQVLQKAMEEASRAIAVDPNEPLAHYALASVYRMQKRHDLAISEFRRAYAHARDACPTKGSDPGRSQRPGSSRAHRHARIAKPLISADR
jgi:Tfp pilus assembly protein PilF